jgi:hypothetical protein
MNTDIGSRRYPGLSKRFRAQFDVTGPGANQATLRGASVRLQNFNKTCRQANTEGHAEPRHSRMFEIAATDFNIT